MCCGCCKAGAKESVAVRACSRPANTAESRDVRDFCLTLFLAAVASFQLRQSSMVDDCSKSRQITVVVHLQHHGTMTSQ